MAVLRTSRALVCVWVLVVGLLAGAPVALADDAATEQARQHYQQAQQAYDIGHWDEAIAEY